MSRMQFGLSAFTRGRGDLPELPVINMFAEEAPTEETGLALQSRPGLTDRAADMGTGPVQALFQADGVMSGLLYGVSNTRFYVGTTEQGVVDGAGPFSIAGYQNKLFTAGGAQLWQWNGATLATVAFPDSASVIKVIVGASRLICIRSDTQQFYWSDPLSENIDALSFATAESQPDKLRDMLFLDDVLILFGSETTEYWPNTGDSTLPFQPLEGRVLEAGIKATGCAVELGATFAWVTNNNRVCVSDPDNVISNSGLEALIEASATVSLFTFWIEGTEFLALRIDDGTWVYSTRSRMWSQFTSNGETNWIAQCRAGDVFGSASDGRTLEWGSDSLDIGGVLERRFRAGFALVSGGVQVNNLIIRTNPGDTSYLVAPYDDPLVEMRRSPDAGRTWGTWKSRSLGAQGAYRTKVQWVGLGMAGQPAFLAEFRMTAPVDFRVSDVRFNEPFGGR